MKRSNYIFLIALTSILVWSCQKEIEYKGEGDDPLLVVNAIVENDSVFKVYLERTVFFLNSENETSKFISSGATLKVTNVNTNTSYTLTQATNGNLYEFPFTVTPNTTYTIEVSHPDYPSVSSKVTTVPNIQLIAVDTISFIEDQQPRMKARIQWNDPAGEHYYMIQLTNKYLSTWDSTYYEYNQGIISYDESIDNSENTDIDGQVYESSQLFFTDEKFDGTTKTLEFRYWFYEDEFNQNDFTLKLIAMNKETYLYLKSAQKNSSSGFFSEPVKVYSNIENGFGIFGSLNLSTWKL